MLFVEPWRARVRRSLLRCCSCFSKGGLFVDQTTQVSEPDRGRRSTLLSIWAALQVGGEVQEGTQGDEE